MEEKKQETTVFREKTLARIASPEQLTDYLRVTTPGTWIVLAAVIALLAGIFVWSAVGTLETKAPVRVIVEGQSAQVVTTGQEKLEAGMPLRVSSQDTVLSSITADEYGRSVGIASVDLPDGTYEGIVVVEQTRPIAFLLNSWE